MAHQTTIYKIKKIQQIKTRIKEADADCIINKLINALNRIARYRTKKLHHYIVGYLLKKNYLRMIAQIDLENNSICHKWYSIDDIRKHTSYDSDKIKDAIEKKEEYSGYIWYKWDNK